LRSYDAERRPVLREVAEDFIAARIARDAGFLARHSPERDRADFERAWAARETDIGTRVQGYEPNYAGSPIVAGAPGATCTAHGEHSFKARAGHHLAPRRLSSGRNVFEELGRGLTLLAFGADERRVAEFEQAARARHVPLKVVRDRHEGELTDYGSRLVLVRPDQFVAWCGEGEHDCPEAVIVRATGSV
jgi:hypothetical protein